MISNVEKRLSSPYFFTFALVVLFLVSLGLRLTWALNVQLPGEAVYSDMGGYVGRAENLVNSAQPDDPYLTAYPYGTHYLFSSIILIFGVENYTALAIVLAIMSSLAVVAITICAKFCFSSAIVPYVVGLALALWYPLISYTGYFSSETPYSFFLCLSILLSFIYIKTGKGALLTGIVYAIGFTIRPQLLMTALMFVAWVVIRKASMPKFQLRSLVLFAAPIIVVLCYSAYRFHHYTGEHALISGNGTVCHLFASTKYLRIESTMEQPDGSIKKRRFQPPSARSLGYTDVFSFKGYIQDKTILETERKFYQSKLSSLEKAKLLWRNIILLAYKNTMWPERNHAKDSWRKQLFDIWPGLVQYYLFPLAFLGFLTLLFRKNIYMEIFALHYITMIYAAMMYFGELRYRVPYDPVLMVLAFMALLVFCKAEPALPKQDVYQIIKSFCQSKLRGKEDVQQQ